MVQILQTVAGGSRGLGYIYAGRVIAGIGIGAISAIAPAYVSECSPKEVRGRITGMFQIMVAIGVMLSYFINLGISLHITTGFRVWRIPLGFQLVPWKPSMERQRGLAVAGSIAPGGGLDLTPTRKRGLSL